MRFPGGSNSLILKRTDSLSELPKKNKISRRPNSTKRNMDTFFFQRLGEFSQNCVIMGVAHARNQGDGFDIGADICEHARFADRSKHDRLGDTMTPKIRDQPF